MLRMSGTLPRGFGRLALSVLVFSGVVRAATPGPEPAALSWARAEGAESCPGASEVTRAVDQRLGRSALVPPDRAELVVEAFVEPASGGGFHVRIALTKNNVVIGRRELEGTEPDCTIITDKAVLAIALMIDPEAPLLPVPAPAPSPPPAPATTSTVAVAVAEHEPPPPPPERPPPWQGDLELAASLAGGLVPGLSPGVFVRGRAFAPTLPFGVELEGAFFPEKTRHATATQGGHFALLYAGLSLCSRPPRAPRLAASFCAGADVGSIVGRGFGFDINERFRSWVFAVGARGRLWFRPVPRLALVLGPDLTIPLRRDHFDTGSENGGVALYRMSSVSLGFAVGAVWEL